MLCFFSGIGNIYLTSIRCHRTHIVSRKQHIRYHYIRFHTITYINTSHCHNTPATTRRYCTERLVWAARLARPGLASMPLAVTVPAPGRAHGHLPGRGALLSASPTLQTGRRRPPPALSRVKASTCGTVLPVRRPGVRAVDLRGRRPTHRAGRPALYKTAANSARAGPGLARRGHWGRGRLGPRHAINTSRMRHGLL